MSESKIQRILALDVLRAIAIVGIVLCHIAYQFPDACFVGRYLGGVFNCVFLSLSALLLGSRWKHQGCPSYSVRNFLWPRIINIGQTYYVFLVFMFIILYFRGEQFSLYDVIMHLAFLSWFDKLPEFGHLWFITMISFAYITFLILSRVWRYIPSFCKKSGFLWGGVFLLVVFLQYFSYYKLHVPTVMIFPYLFFVLISFVFSSELLEMIQNIRLKIFLPCYVILNVGMLVFMYYGMYKTMPMLTVWFGVLCGWTQVVLIYRIFAKRTPWRVLTFLSLISFEIYLVHHALCRYASVAHGPTQSSVLNILFVLTLSLCGAYLLKILVELLQYSCRYVFLKNKLKS